MGGASLGFIGTILLKIIMGFFDRWLLGEKQKEAGRLEERLKQQDAVDEAEEVWDEIDNDDIDLDTALGGLFERAERTED